MSTIVTRAGKGSPLTHVEVDANFTNLNTDKVEKTSADITGGTINGTTIGATTPSTGAFTTIIGQTEVLRGTGQNLLLQSGWTGGTSGTVGSGAVAPTSWSFGATGGTVTYASALSGSGNSVRFAATGSDRPYIQQNFTVVAGLTYSASFTVETVTSGSIPLNQLFLIGGTTSNTTTYFVNGSSATASTNATTGSKVQIVSIIGTISGTTTFRFGIGASSATVGDITLANPQIEIGSTLGTYIPTTTTAVYGTPTLSFSGVSTIGLQSNGALFLQPAGTGAIQAQQATSTTAGGNNRGANAVDWQTSRDTAAKVASGIQAVIGGGGSNVSNNAASTVAGGSGNQATNAYSGVLSGIGQTASGFGAIAIGGYTNTAAGFWNFIGCGFTNSGTSGSAVTTQSATMNGTTAVTLSGSNANIRVGQLITGTSIQTFPNTYVVAISGTSLTLSQAASGSSTSTLSFFTPHGVVVGGGNNQATGSYSFIGGGGDAGTAANRNVASGDWSTVGGGFKNTASGLYSSITGGRGNTASGGGATVAGGGTDGSNNFPNTAGGTSSSVGGGINNAANGYGSSVVGGSTNSANGTFSSVVGGSQGTARSIEGNLVFPAANNPLASSQGSQQASLLVLAVQTTDATATALRSNTSAAGTTNQVILPNNSAYYFRGEIVSGVTGGGNTKGFFIEGVIKRGANAASTTLVGTPTVTSSFADAGASTWAIAVTADTTNGGLRVTFTGQAATTIRTVCQIRTTEMTY